MSTAVKPASAVAHEWAERYIPLASIIKHPPFQVRNGLNAAAVRRYAEMTKAGKVAPPIAVALIGPAHYLVDGWHRMEAGALTLTADDQVLVRIAEMTHKQAVWVAAQANEGHGVQLTRAEWRKVFGAFIKSGQHKLPRGVVMSYRAMGDALV
jgi:hypothetical protein